jgi:hypothetical protein
VNGRIIYFQKGFVKWWQREECIVKTKEDGGSQTHSGTVVRLGSYVDCLEYVVLLLTISKGVYKVIRLIFWAFYKVLSNLYRL